MFLVIEWKRGSQFTHFDQQKSILKKVFQMIYVTTQSAHIRFWCIWC